MTRKSTVAKKVMNYRAEIEQMLRHMPSDWKAQWAGTRKQLRALDYDAPARFASF